MVVEFLDGFSHIINITTIKASVFVGERKIWGLIVSMSTFHVLSLSKFTFDRLIRLFVHSLAANQLI